MAFTKTGAPEKQKVVLSEEEIDDDFIEETDGPVRDVRELDSDEQPDDDTRKD